MRDLTIVIPTFNRPASLARLLRFLHRYEVSAQILVADSSDDGSRDDNRAIAEARAGDAYRAFPADTAPFDKFAAAMAGVKTGFAALLADDDVLLPSALPPILAHLRARPDVVAAHGWYVHMAETAEDLHVTDVAYSGASLHDARAIDRLRRLMTRYEALTYAIFRTPVARKALDAARSQTSMLAKELISGAITAIEGKVSRLPVISHARARGSSIGYQDWHPLEWIARDPQSLFDGYTTYRTALLDALTARPEDDRPGDTEATSRALDLIHLRYLLPYLDPDLLRLAQRHAPGDAMTGEIWNHWNSTHTASARRRNIARAALRAALAPRRTWRRLRAPKRDTVLTTDSNRTIRLSTQFLRDAAPLGGVAARRFAAEIGNY